ncbi:hypothetical protein EFBL_3513 [Effusibacillus lacus]|uniref:Cytosolic protein n=2 Tax=Effusibacillus lacus TaxID=1348429 RepID=A0A292YEP0_9BACL|nr:YbdD/YjiX family protein [Effusibacillus lacus]TCS76275.1 uncharacterized short protein YbdD (DUF466 family) [Effusibacillus lacus]GAX91822.1 hypothetical protein EFBL_3513 [Effusibacillus lacus]
MKQVMGWISQARSNVKTIFGMPDYEKYLEHHKSTHPDQPPMSEKEYYMYALKNRYDSGTVSRCC